MIKFGTSGFRGILGDNYTKENVQRIAHALCTIAKEDEIENPNVVIGYDNRFMSKEFAMWVSEVLATTMKVIFYEIPAPTPLISFETQKANFGIMLTASHNPYSYNGIKVFLGGGRDCDDEYAKRIEKIANKVKYSVITSIPFEDAVKNKKIEYAKNIKSYCDSILSFVDVKKIQKSNLKILSNSMHGNSTACITYLLNKLKVNYEIMNENIDPYFEHGLPAPYQQNLKTQIKRVVNEKFDFGFAFDGDSDRFSLISSSGKYYDCNFVGAVLYYYLISVKKYNCSITKNYALTSLMFKLAENFGKHCYETKVGFKNIALNMFETDSLIGVENNGISFKPHSLIKDGPLVAIFLIDALCAIGKNFDELLNDIQKAMNFKSEMVDYNYVISEQQKESLYKKFFVDKKKPKFSGRKIKTIDYTDGYKIIFTDDYWTMFRFSGTENVVRLYAEMKSLKECNKVIAELEKQLGVKTRQ